MIKTTPTEAEPPAIQSPSELMREWHPGLFSDSKRAEHVSLAQPIFEYHLDTLTSRNEEAAFEYFCRALAEKTICPNLRAQAGPMGGGDGKVDTETYPVAEAISERWWIGSPKPDERWAFAFSAMKDWKKKVRSDVKKIAETDRGYSRVYFITNQFAKASTRSDLEAKLGADFGIPVTILDRAWIVQKVYDDGFLGLAIEKLNIPGVQIEQGHVAGALDTERLAELNELDLQIADPDRYGNARYQLVEDVLQAALIARSLERPRAEIEGRFLHAKALAEPVGDAFQLQRIAYDRAWTAYWFFEDYQGFNALYGEVQTHAKGATEGRRLEMLSTLWQVLNAAAIRGIIDLKSASLKDRTAHLESELCRIISDTARPNSGLYAETLLEIVKLNKAWALKDNQAVDGVWRALSDIIDRSEPLGAYPIELIAELTGKLGRFLDGAAYDAFFEKLTDVMRKRRSDGEAGEAYLARGWQKLELEKPYDAIRMFGRAEALLIKDEYKAELTEALAGASVAYQRVGLEWAARNKLLAATERALSVYQTEGKFIPPALSLLRRLIWAELGLGRVPQTLLAIRFAEMVRAVLNLEEEQIAEQDAERINQDAILGILMMKVPTQDLPQLEKLPNMLNGLSLGTAEVALLYALGHEKQLLEEGSFPGGPAELDEFFARLRGQPASKDIAAVPVLFGDGPSVLRSVILGCEIAIEVPSDPVAMAIAESLLGGLEAFLATSTEDQLFPYREKLRVRMVRGDADMFVPTLEFPSSDAQPGALTYPQDMPFTDPAQMSAYSNWLQDAIIDALVRVVRIRDVEKWMEQIAGEEQAFSRAIALGNILTLTRNIFGYEAPLTLADWISPDAETYPLVRSQGWPENEQKPGAKSPPKFSSKAPPTGFPDLSTLKHTDRKIASPIDMNLWDQAEWGGVGFEYYEGHPVPPAAMLLFKNEAAARAIFEGWRARFGRSDDRDILRVAIVTGLNKIAPASYGVVIGVNFANQLVDEDDGKMVMMVSRMQRMENPSPQNLNGFLDGYRATGAYFLVPAVMRPGAAEPDVFEDLAILKRSLDLKAAWTITDNDMDMSILSDDDDPFVPDGVEDAPVIGALARISELRQTRGQ